MSVFGGDDCIIMLIVDGENVWEEYCVEYDGKGFYYVFYVGLSEFFEVGEIVMVMVLEYIDGNFE